MMIVFDFLYQLFHVFTGFLYAPLFFPQMLWIIAPVLLAIILTEIYFFMHPRENLTFHKSLENTVFLLFISIDLIRYIAINHSQSMPKIYVTGAFIVFCIIIAVLDFFHKLPLSVAFRMSSKVIIAFLSYVSIALVYSNLLDTITPLNIFLICVSIVLLFVLLVIVRGIFVLLEPKSYEEIEHYLGKVESDLRKASEESIKDIEHSNAAEKKIEEKKKHFRKNHPR